jgi:hypothetical protein
VFSFRGRSPRKLKMARNLISLFCILSGILLCGEAKDRGSKTRPIDSWSRLRPALFATKTQKGRQMIVFFVFFSFHLAIFCVF